MNQIIKRVLAWGTVLAIFAGCFFLTGTATSAGNDSDNSKIRPLLTIVDDDGKMRFDTIYRPFLEKGIPITCAIDPVHWVGQEGRLDWKIIAELQNLGCEFVVHDVNRWTDGYKNNEEMAAFFKEAQAEFVKHNLPAVDIGIYPQGANVPRTIRFLQSYLIACATTSATNNGLYYSTYPITEPLRIPRFPIVSNEEGKHVSLKDIKAQIDGTVADNGWLILYGHSHYKGYDDELVQIMFDAIDYAKSQGMDVVSMREGLDMFLPSETAQGAPAKTDSTSFSGEKITWYASIYDGDKKLVDNIPQTAYLFDDGLVLIRISINSETLNNLAINTQLQIRGLPYPAISAATIGLRISAPDYLSVLAQPSGGNNLIIKDNNGGNIKPIFKTSGIISGVVFAINE